MEWYEYYRLFKYEEAYYRKEDGDDKCLNCDVCRYSKRCLEKVSRDENPLCVDWIDEEIGGYREFEEDLFGRLWYHEIVDRVTARLIGFAIAEMVLSEVVRE